MLFPFKGNSIWGMINEKGKIIVYEYAFDFKNGVAATILSGKYGYVDNTGKELFRAKKVCIEPYYSFANW